MMASAVARDSGYGLRNVEYVAVEKISLDGGAPKTSSICVALKSGNGVDINRSKANTFWSVEDA